MLKERNKWDTNTFLISILEIYILSETGICYISIVLGNKKDGVTLRDG